MKRQLQKWHYLSEFLRLSEILNFFAERSFSRFFWVRPHRPIGRPNRPNRPFFMKNQKKFVKNGQKVGVHNLAGNSRFHKILLKTYSLVSWDLLWWILDHYIIFISFGSVINFGEKIFNFSKIKLREILPPLNPLEKIHKISWKKFKKISKISFFFKIL